MGRTPPLLVPGFYEGADNPFEDENEPKSEAEMAAAAVWMERSFVFCVGAALGEWLYRNNMGELWGKNPVSEEFAAKGEEFMTAVAESICHRPALVSAECVFGVIENNKGRIVELLKDGAERFMEKVDVLEEASAAANGKKKWWRL